jgi:hypothetical protein
MRSFWMGIVIAVFILIALFYLSSANVQKLRAESNISTIQTG